MNNKIRNKIIYSYNKSSQSNMTTGLNLNTVNLAIEVGASFGLLVLTIVAMAYVTCSEKRVQDCTQAAIFITLIISCAFQATLSLFDLYTNDKS